MIPTIILGQGSDGENTWSALETENIFTPEGTKFGIPPFTPVETQTITSPEGAACGWTNATVYPITVLDQALTAVGGNLYSFAGVSTTITANSYKFNGSSWTPIAALPVALEYPAAVSDGTSAYIFGGVAAGGAGTVNTMYRYNPGTNDYTTLTPSGAATSTWNHAATILNGKIYKIGGYNSAGGITTSLNTVEIYDIASNTWSTGAPYPLAQGWMSAFAHNGFIYVGGGVSSVTGSVPTAKTYRYDPVGNVWDDAAIADLPLSRWGAASSITAYDNGWVLAGGYVNGAAAANISATVITWNPATNSWGTLPDMVAGARARTPGAIFNSGFHVVGGRSVASSGFVGTNTNQRLFCIDQTQPFITGIITYVSDNGTPQNNVPDPGETATVSLALKNDGGVPSGNVVATLLPAGGITNPSGPESYGVINVDQTVSRNFTFQVPGGAPCGGQITLTFDVADGPTHYTVTKTYTLGTITTPPVTFTNATQVDLPGGQPVTTAGPSAPYPSTINVAGVSGPRGIKITLNGFRHEWYNDVDFLLVGPGGQKYIFMSDNGPGSTELLPPITFSIADSGADLLPTTAVAMQNGVTYRPSNIGANDVFDAPAPAGPYENAAPGGTATFASVFGTDGAAMNGAWSLYGDDDASGDFGFMSGGWTISFESLQYTCTTVNTLRSRADFDGDGRTDLSVFRPSEGNWYLQQSTAGFAALNWGISSDTLVPGDYDGDRKADLAVFRPNADSSQPDFYILNSNGFTVSGYSWGVPGDVPDIRNYDGDERDDIAVFRPSNGTWYILKTTGGVTVEPFGLNGDVPVAGDFDNDGKANLAVFRPSNNTWYIARATGVPAQNYDSVSYGLAGDKLVQADYDGDNREDIAVYRPSNGTWYIRSSSNGSTSTRSFGISTDIPVPGDYDGDGSDDVAVYRDGTWYIAQSTSGLRIQPFGIASDRAIPKQYIP